MASRRSRLKAVANLPIRRKPTAVQENVEDTKVQCNPEEEVKAAVLVKDSENEESGTSVNAAKVPDGKVYDIPVSSGDASSMHAEKISPVNCKNELERPKTEVPSPMECTPTLNTSTNSSCNAGSRFGRRVKPIVSLSVLKERPQTVKQEKIIKVESDCNIKENQSSLQDHNFSGATNNSNNGLRNTQVEKKGVFYDVINIKGSQSDKTIASDNQCEKISIESEPCNVEKSDVNKSQCHGFKKDTCNNINKEFENLNSTSTRINSNQSQTLTTNSLNNKILTNRLQTEPESPINKNLSEFPINQLQQDNVNTHSHYHSVSNKRNSSVVKQKKIKFNDYTRKVADARREFQRKYEKIPPDRSSLRMIDLIFYNPSTNPMESKSKMDKKEFSSVDQDLLESKVDDPEPMDKSVDLGNYDEMGSDEFGKMPVPQVKIGSNGEIILDEKSLVIETTDAKRGREDLQNSVPVFEDRGSKTCYYKRKTQKSRDWSDIETKRFYKALNTIGTDFSLMQRFFPNRSRLELKNKFKREEKLNRNLIDRALNNPSEFDIAQFEKYLASEKKAEEEIESTMQQKVKSKKQETRSRTKSSVLAREISESDEDVIEVSSYTPSDGTKRKLNKNSKKSTERELLCQKYSFIRDNYNEEGDVQIFQNESNNDSIDPGNNNLPTSELFNRQCMSRLDNGSRVRDPLDEILSVHGKPSKDSKSVHENNEVQNSLESGELVNNGKCVKKDTVFGEFFNAVVDLSNSLKNEKMVTENKSKSGKSMRGIGSYLSAKEKRKVSLHNGRNNNKKRRKENQSQFISTLDVETYDCNKCDDDDDDNSSSNESSDNCITSTRTVTDQDFIKLLAANAENMKESKIQFQIIGDNSSEKKVEIILDNVPSVAFNEVQGQKMTTLADYKAAIDESETSSEGVAKIVRCEEIPNDIQILQGLETSVIVRNPNAVNKSVVVQKEGSDNNGTLVDEFYGYRRLNLVDNDLSDPLDNIVESKGKTFVSLQNGNICSEKLMGVISNEDHCFGNGNTGPIVGNENFIFVIDGNEDGISKNFQYMVVEDQL